jgi:hypothetical protein
MDFQEQHRKILGGWATSLGLNFEIFYATTVVNPTEPGPGNRLTSSGSSLWAVTEGVHLSSDGYRDLTLGLADLAKDGGDSDSHDESMSTSSENQKRKRPDSVVMVPYRSKNATETKHRLQLWWNVLPGNGNRRECITGARARMTESPGAGSLTGRGAWGFPGRGFWRGGRGRGTFHNNPNKW